MKALACENPATFEKLNGIQINCTIRCVFWGEGIKRQGFRSRQWQVVSAATSIKRNLGSIQRAESFRWSQLRGRGNQVSLAVGLFWLHCRVLTVVNKIRWRNVCQEAVSVVSERDDGGLDSFSKNRNEGMMIIHRLQMQ